MGEAQLGRPRSAAVHEAILAATRELLIEGGYAALSMDRVAARAAVGKQSVYRRWPAKAPLVAEAVLGHARTTGSTEMPDTGDIHRDLRTWLRSFATFLAEPTNGGLARALAAAAADDPQDADALYQQLTGPARTQLIERLRAGVAAGQLRTDADLYAAADALVGALLYQLLARDSPMTPTRRMAGLLDVIMSGLRHRPVE